jgi:hypothetical protein
MRLLSVFALLAVCFVWSSGSVGSKSTAEHSDISRSGRNSFATHLLLKAPSAPYSADCSLITRTARNRLIPLIPSSAICSSAKEPEYPPVLIAWPVALTLSLCFRILSSSSK